MHLRAAIPSRLFAEEKIDCFVDIPDDNSGSLWRLNALYLLQCPKKGSGHPCRVVLHSQATPGAKPI